MKTQILENLIFPITMLGPDQVWALDEKENELLAASEMLFRIPAKPYDQIGDIDVTYHDRFDSEMGLLFKKNGKKFILMERNRNNNNQLEQTTISFIDLNDVLDFLRTTKKIKNILLPDRKTKFNLDELVENEMKERGLNVESLSYKKRFLNSVDAEGLLKNNKFDFGFKNKEIRAIVRFDPNEWKWYVSYKTSEGKFVHDPLPLIAKEADSVIVINAAKTLLLDKPTFTNLNQNAWTAIMFNLTQDERIKAIESLKVDPNNPNIEPIVKKFELGAYYAAKLRPTPIEPINVYNNIKVYPKDHLLKEGSKCDIRYSNSEPGALVFQYRELQSNELCEIKISAEEVKAIEKPDDLINWIKRKTFYKGSQNIDGNFIKVSEIDWPQLPPEIKILEEKLSRTQDPIRSERKNREKMLVKHLVALDLSNKNDEVKINKLMSYSWRWRYSYDVNFLYLTLDSKHSTTLTITRKKLSELAKLDFPELTKKEAKDQPIVNLS